MNAGLTPRASYPGRPAQGNAGRSLIVRSNDAEEIRAHFSGDSWARKDRPRVKQARRGVFLEPESKNEKQSVAGSRLPTRLHWRDGLYGAHGGANAGN